MSARDEAKGLLVHYLSRAMPPDYYSPDSLSEMEAIVDRIVDAAVDEVRSILPARGTKGRPPHD